ncbi:hypothetical protein SCHPADRAFT_904914 [Schizopora paradoxa]|uniref:Uncharacterized protein n=1 Tax=Schizopora paradoxa TaxID=27342 RepID=A0A0H2RM38_9AGAM|nr:hypothetical protein SCHPADRAFT_904914 [Schizopora paradoxa]
MMFNTFIRAFAQTVTPWTVVESTQSGLDMSHSFAATDDGVASLEGSEKGTMDLGIEILKIHVTDVDENVNIEISFKYEGIPAATDMADDETGSATGFNDELEVTSHNNQAIQAEKISALKKGKQPMSTPVEPAPQYSGFSHPNTASTSNSSSGPYFCEATLIPGLLNSIGIDEESDTQSSQASPVAQGKSSASLSQVTLSSSEATPMGWPSAAVQEDRPSREAFLSSEDLAIFNQPSLWRCEDVDDTHESRGESAAPMGQDTLLVPAVQESATLHGEEIVLDEQDSEDDDREGSEAGDHDVGQAEAAPVVGWGVPAVHDIPRHLQSDEYKNDLMHQAWDAFEDLRHLVVVDPETHAEDYLDAFYDFARYHSDAPFVQADKSLYEMPDVIVDLMWETVPDFDPDDYALWSPPLTQEEICASLPRHHVYAQDFVEDSGPKSTSISSASDPSPPLPVPVVFDAVKTLMMFDVIWKAVRAGRFLAIARYIRPDDLFRLVSVGFIKLDDLDWADARAHYFIGKVRVQNSLRSWTTPKNLAFPSASARKTAVENFETEWKKGFGADSLDGVPFEGNPIAWIDGCGEECPEPPFPLDQEAFQMIYAKYFLEKHTTSSGRPQVDPLESRSSQIERSPSPSPSPKNKRPREDSDPDSGAPSSGPSDDDAPSPSKKPKHDGGNSDDDDDDKPSKPKPSTPLRRSLRTRRPVIRGVAPLCTSRPDHGPARPPPQNAVAGPSMLETAFRRVTTFVSDLLAEPPRAGPSRSRKRAADDSDEDADSESSPLKKARRGEAITSPIRSSRRKGKGKASARRASRGGNASSSSSGSSGASGSSASSSASPRTPDGSQDVDVEILEMPHAPVTAAPQPPSPPPFVPGEDEIVPSPRNALRRRETTLWNGKLVTSETDLDGLRMDEDEEQEL